MADKVRYPQIPSTVWWGLRSILQKTPNVTADERLLGVQLGVQEAAARAYVMELKHVGILTDEGKATPLAQKWRLDETYPEAVTELIEAIYPENLFSVAPPSDGDRQKIVSWFLREGLGQGAAGNKAATYLLIGSPSPNDASNKAKNQSAKQEGKSQSTRPAAKASKTATGVQVRQQGSSGDARSGVSTRVPDHIPFNVNVQIHISADAGTEQIEAIFSAMRRYLYDSQGS